MPDQPRKRRTPGAGLGFVFPPDEAPTAKLPAIPEAPPADLVACPMCNGRGVLRISAYLNDEPCPTCQGRKNVTTEERDDYIKKNPGSVAAQLARRKLTPP